MFSCSNRLTLKGDGGMTFKIPLDKVDVKFKTTNFENNFYVGFDDGDIIKISKKSGDILWKKNIDTLANTAFAMDEDNLYFVSINNDFYVLDKETGKIKFIYYGANETTILNQTPPIVLADGILVIFHNNRVSLFSKKDWSVVWSKFLDNKKVIQKDDIVVVDGKIFIHDIPIN
jgi:outer membrane protein assembly factor BamB